MAGVQDAALVVRLYWPLLLGNILEWYEYSVYAFLETYLEHNFFQGSTVATWAGFGCTFFARPFGGLFLGILGDIHGSRLAAVTSIAGMLIGTVGQGCLPTYQNGNLSGHIGLALLVLLRFVQGLCAGGELATIIAFITEVSPHASLGRCIALIGITGNIGFLAARSIVFASRTLLGEETMFLWGWRLPFVIAVVPGTISLVGRRLLAKAEVKLGCEDGKSAGNREPSDIAEKARNGGVCQAQASKSVVAVMRETCTSHLLAIVFASLSVSCHAVIQYLGLAWTKSYLARHGTGVDVQLMAGMCSRGFMILLGIPVGWLADIYGIGSLMFVGAFAQTILAVPLWIALRSIPSSTAGIVSLYGFGLGSLGALNTTVSFLYIVELFPATVRNVGVGIGWNVGLAIFGGCSPMLAEALLRVSPNAPGLLISSAGALTCVTVISGLFLQRKGILQLAHVRPQPYFYCCDRQVSSKSEPDESDETSSQTDSSHDSQNMYA